MKKRKMLLLALMLALVPVAGRAQDMPQMTEWPEWMETVEDVYQSIGEGLNQGAALAMESLSEELTLAMQLDGDRIEEGKSLCLTLTAGNPLPKEVNVSLMVQLPQRLSMEGEAAWEATLPAAQLDEETGRLIPSETSFTRELTLMPGGSSEQVMIGSELAMGTRFYRAEAPLALCVPDIHVEATIDGPQNHRMQPGDAFAWQLSIANAGDAPKDVAVELILPEAVALTQELPEGFVMTGSTISGQVHAPAANEEGPSSTVLSLPAVIEPNALDGDEDAHRLIAGTLRADGTRVPLERIEVCGPKINAKLVADTTSLEEGEETTLSVVVVNSGLAAADVRLSCLLPEGIALRSEEGRRDEDAKNKAVTTDNGDAAGPDAAPVMTQQERALMLQVHMEPAEESESGLVASTQVIELPVIAQAPQNNLNEQLVGAALAWSVDEEEMQLGEAVAMRVVRPQFMGLSRSDWNGVFWAGVLLVVTMICFYAAVKRENREEDFCCE